MRKTNRLRLTWRALGVTTGAAMMVIGLVGTAQAQPTVTAGWSRGSHVLPTQRR